jgi:fluoride exporter
MQQASNHWFAINRTSKRRRSALRAIIAVSLGAALGALLRWMLALKLNQLFPALPPGTLVANLVGAYVIGVAVAFFASAPGIPGEWRLLIVTGFCGGLTTFSTFSSEVVALLQQGRIAMAGGEIAIHVAGSVAMTFLGIASYALAAAR